MKKTAAVAGKVSGFRLERPHIIVAGDSFGCGEWEQGLNVTHGGVAQYLYEDGFEVSNLSQPGGALSWSINPIENFFIANPFANIKKIIFFQTDIARDLPNQIYRDHCEKFIREFPDDTVKQTLDKLYKEFYKSLDSVANHFGVEILAIGGLTDITADISDFSNIRIGIPSMAIEANNSVPGPLRLLSNPTQWKILDELFSHRKDELLELMEEQCERHRYLRSDIRYKDKFHPGREIHKICYEKLKNYLC